MVEDISRLFNKLMEDLETNITDKAQKSKIKNELVELVSLFISSSNNLIKIQDKQEMTLNRIKKLERKISQIEEDIYIDDEENNYDKMHDNDYEFEIRCPYCDYDFIISEESQATDEIECPQCHNIIELDWDDASECAKDCKSCKQHCYQDEEEKDSQVEQLSEENEEYKPDNNEKNNIKDNTNDPKNNENQNNANNIQDLKKNNEDKNKQNNNEDDM